MYNMKKTKVQGFQNNNNDIWHFPLVTTSNIQAGEEPWVM